jgi:hypothetical protein
LKVETLEENQVAKFNHQMHNLNVANWLSAMHGMKNIKKMEEKLLKRSRVVQVWKTSLI